eukprot:TRINITY_DN4416_c0_g1_i2.p1 TRINITY_DN4416_c0_g1~~TRINITY_DN4416_c0_g1_i2.p1  ORF type:complete len:473 (+),score=99.51 TRINITY_DN4416_c0_g1_i2:132-1550(+)
MAVAKRLSVTWFDERLGEFPEWSQITKNTFIEIEEEDEEERRAAWRRERSAPASVAAIRGLPINREEDRAHLTSPQQDSLSLSPAATESPQVRSLLRCHSRGRRPSRGYLRQGRSSRSSCSSMGSKGSKGRSSGRSSGWSSGRSSGRRESRRSCNRRRARRRHTDTELQAKVSLSCTSAGERTSTHLRGGFGAARGCQSSAWELPVKNHFAALEGEELQAANEEELETRSQEQASRCSPKAGSDKRRTKVSKKKPTPSKLPARSALIVDEGDFLDLASDAEDVLEAEAQSSRNAECEPVTSTLESVNDDVDIAKLTDQQANVVAALAVRGNELLIGRHLQSKATCRITVAAPTDPGPAWAEKVADVLPIELGGVAECELADSGWCFGTAIAPASIAGRSGCFRQEGTRLMVVEVAHAGSGEALACKPAKWAEFTGLKDAGMKQQRLRRKAILNRLQAARKAWEAESCSQACK